MLRVREDSSVALGSVAALSARVLASWFGALSLLNVAAGLRLSTFDPNIWWIDLRFLPAPVRDALVLLVGAMLVAFAFRPATGGGRRLVSFAATSVVAGVALLNAAAYYRAWGTGAIVPGSPVPLSLVIAILLGLIALSMRRPATSSVSRARFILVSAAVSMAFVIGLPLLQMTFFGTTDHRRPADAAVVFGARVKPDGTASIVLADRVTTASGLYRDGFVGTIVMTGGIESSGFDETVVMRDLAEELGVPADAIVLDPGGINTLASVANTSRLFRDRGLDRVLAVSQFYHLPRIKLAYARAGIDVWTVPSRNTSIPRTRAIMAREIPAFWLYYLRAVLG